MPGETAVGTISDRPDRFVYRQGRTYLRKRTRNENLRQNPGSVEQLRLMRQYCPSIGTSFAAFSWYSPMRLLLLPG